MDCSAAIAAAFQASQDRIAMGLTVGVVLGLVVSLLIYGWALKEGLV